MKIEWESNENIGHHECILTEDDGYQQTISLTDYTCAFQRERKEKDCSYKSYHPDAYEVRYCHGYSMHEVFDESYTLEDVKIWCEDYLLNGYIDHYNHILSNLEKIKRRAEWATLFKENRTKF